MKLINKLIAIVIVAITLSSCNKGNDKIVVLTFDDAVKSHRNYVGPILKDLDFGATFFVTQFWMADTVKFMTWKEVAELNEMGFEIGNHSWTHIPFDSPEAAAKLRNELTLVENALAEYNIPKPVSFGWCGNHFGPEAVKVLRDGGYKYARRGMQPEIPYGKMQQGPLFDPDKHNGLLIPTTADAYPEWTLDYFKSVVDRHEPGKAVILQFHGVPDIQHPWVHTDPVLFKQCMNYLKENDFTVIGLKDLSKYMEVTDLQSDPMLNYRYAFKNPQ